MKNVELHRNSQKRFYGKDKIYFITANTFKRFPFFKEDLFCELFIENLKICKQIKPFRLYAFTIIPDHVHLLLEPVGKFNISQIMFSIKKQFSHDVNRVIGINKDYFKYHKNNMNIEVNIEGEQHIEGEQTFARLQCVINNHQKRVGIIHKKFIQKYGHPQYDMPDFKWQQSFHDHVIRHYKNDFLNHYNYIIFNCIKHGICDNEEKYRWSSLNPEFRDLVDDWME